MFLEILKHDGPVRLGRLKHEDENLKLDVATPNFFSIATNGISLEHDLYLASHRSTISEKNVLVDYGSLYEEKPILRLGILPEARAGLKAPREIAEQAVEKTIEFATKHPGHGAVVQGGKYVGLRRKSAEAFADRPLLAIADGLELLEHPRSLVNIVTAVREAASPNTALYYPFAPPHMFYLLAYMGVDLFDTGDCLLRASERMISTSRGHLRLDEISELPCTCSICRNKKPEDLLEDYNATLNHNFNVALGIVREIRVAIKAGRYRELVEEKAAISPRTMASLRLLDREKQDFLEKYTPIAP